MAKTGASVARRQGTHAAPDGVSGAGSASASAARGASGRASRGAAASASKARGTTSATSHTNSITINLTDEGRMKALNVILRYEAATRCLSLGQTMSALLSEASMRRHYPPEVASVLKDLRAEREAVAANRCLMSLGA